MTMKTLDLEAVQAFVLVADLKSFTRAAEAMGSTQSAVSLKLKRLEARLGHRLIERTPRMVRLSPDGGTFLAAARDLVTAHERAVARFEPTLARLTIGMSQHIVGPELPMLLKRMNAQDRSVVVEIRIATSNEVLDDFDNGALDAALVLRHNETQRDGEVLLTERFGWYAATDWVHQPGEPLRIATQSTPCSLRATATRTLDGAGIRWSEVFVGGGVATIGAAVSAGLAVAALSRRCAPADTIDVGGLLGLPSLPSSDVVLHARIDDARVRASLRSFAAAFRATAK